MKVFQNPPSLHGGPLRWPAAEEHSQEDKKGRMLAEAETRSEALCGRNFNESTGEVEMYSHHPQNGSSTCQSVNRLGACLL